MSPERRPLRRAAYVAVLSLVAAAIGGCRACVPSPDEREPIAIAQAAADLTCPRSELRAKFLGERLFDVTGCGRKATYRVICKLTVSSCYVVGGPEEAAPATATATRTATGTATSAAPTRTATGAAAR